MYSSDRRYIDYLNIRDKNGTRIYLLFICALLQGTATTSD
jgi:hypothetical protein